MELTKDDTHICRILFNIDTLPMGIAMYGDRAREIYRYVCDVAFAPTHFFEYMYKDDFPRNFLHYPTGAAFERVLRKEPLASFFFDNGLINFGSFDSYNIYQTLRLSPIAEKIWDSGELEHYLHKLHSLHIEWVLKHSPIVDKIKASGKLKLA